MSVARTERLAMLVEGVAAPFWQFPFRAEAGDPLREFGDTRNSIPQVEKECAASCRCGIAWQIGNQPVSQLQSVTARVVIKKLRFHTCHVDTSRAFPFATFAAHAKGHGFAHLVGCEGVLSELSG